jgi:hypothetical protein
VGILRKRVLVVGSELQELVEPIRKLGYEALFGERHDHVLHLAAAFNPAIALISEIECMRNPQLPAELDHLLGSAAVSVLPSASVSAFLERSSSAQSAGNEG